MVTKELLKTEIDKMPNEHLGVLYRIIRALEEPAETAEVRRFKTQSEWKAFVAETYGSMADSPIQRGDQGSFEVREKLR